MAKTTKDGHIGGEFIPAGTELTNEQMFNWAPAVGSEPGRAVEQTTPPPADTTSTPASTSTSTQTQTPTPNSTSGEKVKYVNANGTIETVTAGSYQESNMGVRGFVLADSPKGQKRQGIEAPATEQGGDIRGRLLGPAEFASIVNNFQQAGLTDSEIEEFVINRTPNTLSGQTDIFLKQGVEQNQAFIDNVVAKREEGADVGSGGDVGSNISGDLTDQQEQQQTEQTAGNIENLLANSGLPQDQQDLIKTIVEAYPENTDISDEAILETFESLSKQIIDPHFASLVKQIQADLTVAIDRTRQDRETEREQELINAQERFRQGQLGLERSGLTRSGEGVRQLGSESGARGVASGTEGNVQRLSRNLAESSGLAFSRGIQDLGRKGESLLGSEGVGAIEGFTPVGSVVGSIPQAKTTAQANLLGQLSGQQGSLVDFQRKFI